MRSLRARLLVACAVILAGFLVTGGLALESAFRDAALAAQRDRLTGLIYGLLGATEEGSDGSLVIFHADLPDPRLRDAGSGLEAAILRRDGTALWASPGYRQDLAPPRTVAVGEWDFAQLDRPKRLRLAFGFRWLGLDAVAEEYTAVVFEDTRALDTLLRRFRRSLWGGFAAIAVGLTIAMLAALTWLMRPVNRLTEALRRIESGEADEIDGRVPVELEPLVAATNAMIRRERTQLARYRHALSDLAHSLKTPLAVIRGALERGAGGSQADTIGEQVDRMRDIVDHQLSRAGRAGRRTLTRPVELRPLAHRVAQAIQKVHAARSLNVELAPGPELAVRADRGDLFEILGNLTENAARFAQQAVRIELRERGGFIDITVEDDGPGFPDDAEGLLQRWQRADTRHPGQGIGLAVVHELLGDYQGQIEIGRSASLGGARVRVSLPAR